MMRTMPLLLPKGFPVRRRGSCVPAAVCIIAQLGSDAEAVSGFVEGEEHTWVVYRRRIIDPTLGQFPWIKTPKPRRIIVARQPRDVFLGQVRNVMRRGDEQADFYSRFAKWCPFLDTALSMDWPEAKPQEACP